MESAIERVANAPTKIGELIEQIKTATDDKTELVNTACDVLFGTITNRIELAGYAQRIRDAAGRGYGDYCKTCITQHAKMAAERAKHVQGINATQFLTPPEEMDGPYDTGSFIVDESGIREITPEGERVVVNHIPVIPVERMTNREDNTIKIKLAYLTDGRWRTIQTDLLTISDKRAIISLAAYGTGINSENAASMVRYISTVLANNADRMPNTHSATHLGWVGDDFVPYIGKTEFDGDENMRRTFESVRENGDFGPWFDVAIQARKRPEVRIFMDAALAAPLLKRIGAQSFFVHMWGASQCGKTVALRLALSIYGDPNDGQLLNSLSSTMVGTTLIAGMLGNLPAGFDEAETARDREKFTELLYTMTGGMSKAKGTRSGGLAASKTWNTIFMTTGEAPLTDSDSKAGAINRMINIECGNRLFDDPSKVADTVKENFGFMGARWIDLVQMMRIDDLKDMYHEKQKELEAVCNASGKQLAAGAALLLADSLGEILFNDGAIDPAEVGKRLVDMDQISAYNRAYEMVCNWVAACQGDFLPEAGPSVIDTAEPEVVGTRHALGRFCRGGAVAIIADELKHVLAERGYSYDAFLSAADEAGVIVDRDKDRPNRKTKHVRMGSANPRCVVIKLAS